jgi:tetratricopeptide (TPR) repeat protein
MHRRWGQDTPDSEHFSSYTEEEFHRALERWKKDQAPVIFVFFKHIDSSRMADPGLQLQKVLDFRKELEKTRTVLYRQFAVPGPRTRGEVSDSKSAKEFGRLMQEHLQAYALDELPKSDPQRDIVVLPVDSIRVLEEAQEKARKEAERAEALEQRAVAAEAREEEHALQLAKHAAQAALDGHVEEARQTFAKVTESTTNLEILFLAYDFFERTGDLDTAEQLCERRLALSGPDDRNADTAHALGNLGLIYRTQGDLEQAEAMHRKSLAINEELGRKEGMASDYGNLGWIQQERGKLD